MKPLMRALICISIAYSINVPAYSESFIQKVAAENLPLCPDAETLSHIIVVPIHAASKPEETIARAKAFYAFESKLLEARHSFEGGASLRSNYSGNRVSATDLFSLGTYFDEDPVALGKDYFAFETKVLDANHSFGGDAGLRSQFSSSSVTPIELFSLAKFSKEEPVVLGKEFYAFETKVLEANRSFGGDAGLRSQFSNSTVKPVELFSLAKFSGEDPVVLGKEFYAFETKVLEANHSFGGDAGLRSRFSSSTVKPIELFSLAKFSGEDPVVLGKEFYAFETKVLEANHSFGGDPGLRSRFSSSTVKPIELFSLAKFSGEDPVVLGKEFYAFETKVLEAKNSSTGNAALKSRFSNSTVKPIEIFKLSKFIGEDPVTLGEEFYAFEAKILEAKHSSGDPALRSHYTDSSVEPFDLFRMTKIQDQLRREGSRPRVSGFALDVASNAHPAVTHAHPLPKYIWDPYRGYRKLSRDGNYYSGSFSTGWKNFWRGF